MFRAVKKLYDAIIRDTWHYTFVQTHRIYNTNREPYCNTLVGDSDNEGDCAYGEAEGIWKICVPASQFCYVLKTVLKTKVY